MLSSMHASTPTAMGPRVYSSGGRSDNRRDDPTAILGSERTRVGSAPFMMQMHAQARPSRSVSPPPFCPLSKPAALGACIVLTLLWLWLTAHPLLSGPVRLVHAHRLHIDIPDAETAPAPTIDSVHPHAGVLVLPQDDLEAVSQWRSVLHHLHHQQALPSDPLDPSAVRQAAPPFSCYGVHAQRGRRRYMEDTHAVYLNHVLHYSSAKHAHLCSRDTEEREADITSPWALFGVFDGHGGQMASEYAAAYLLPSVHSALLHHGHTGGVATSLTPLDAPALSSAAASSAVPLLNASACISDAFQRLDREFLDLVARPQNLHDGSTALVAGVYYRRDAALRGEAPFQLVVANLGDCRAVYVMPFADDISLPVAEHVADATDLDRADDDASTPLRGAVLALSVDHKPDLDVERAFVESQGGFVTPGGRRDVARVQGVLGVSRALGDSPLKPMVRSEPDVRTIDLDDVDEFSDPDAGAGGGAASCEFERSAAAAAAEADVQGTCGSDFGGRAAAAGASAGASGASSVSPLLLLGSDGFWDVFSNEDAAAAALDYLRRHPSVAPKGEPLLSALAHHLVAQAYLRGSMDNITLMAIDVKCVQRWLRKQMHDQTVADAATQAADAAAPASSAAIPPA